MSRRSAATAIAIAQYTITVGALGYAIYRHAV
jgi:hypothetical protein